MRRFVLVSLLVCAGCGREVSRSDDRFLFAANFGTNRQVCAASRELLADASRRKQAPDQEVMQVGRTACENVKLGHALEDFRPITPADPLVAGTPDSTFERVLQSIF